MKQWIRWSGLIGFIAISAILVLGWLFAAGPLIKYSIETFGSKAAKAKVEVADVSLTFEPFGIEITGVQVASAENPMENVLQFDRAVADIELLPLLLGKGIVNEVALSGVAFSTPRQTSGELSKAEATIDETEDDAKEDTGKEKTAIGESVSQALPSADELLAREPLLTEQRGRKFQQSVTTIKEESNQAIAALPDSKAFDSYEDEFKRLTSGKFDSVEDFKQRKKEFDALKKRIKQDQKAISKAKTVLSEGQKNLRQQWADLKGAPGEDFANLKGKYKLDGAGIANLSRLMFGDSVGEWSQEGLYWYEKIRPFLVSDDSDKDEATAEEAKKARAKGRFIHFDTDRPLPDLLVRKVHLMVKLPEVENQPLGDVAIRVYNITHQQAVINKPITLIAKGQNLNNIQSIDLNGTLDYRTSPGKDVFDLAVKGVGLKNYNIGAMGLKLDRSQIDIIGQAELVAGNIDASSKAMFSKAAFSSKDKTLLAKEMAIALQKIDRFDIDASATGKLKAPKVGISSNLDSKLSTAFNQRIKEKQQELEKQLKNKLNDKLLAYAGDYQEQLKELDLANGSLSEKQEKLKALAKSELSSFEEQQKAEAQRKIDEKRDAERAKAKAEADKKKKDLEKKAKDKFKNLF